MLFGGLTGWTKSKLGTMKIYCKKLKITRKQPRQETTSNKLEKKHKHTMIRIITSKKKNAKVTYLMHKKQAVQEMARSSREIFITPYRDLPI